MLEEKEAEWLQEKVGQLLSDPNARKFYLAFGMVPRVIKRSPISPTSTQIEGLRAISQNFDPSQWRKDEIGRLALMLSLPSDKNFAIIDPLFTTADMNELVALYKGLYFLDDKERFVERAIDGIRTNMSPVFDAIALNSMMPFIYFNETAWNQVVLKAIFMGRPIYRIFGLDERRNAALAQIARDFAHERWSAGRKVTPELWRLTEPFIDEAIFGDLKKAFLQGDGLERSAAGKAMRSSGYQPALDWIDEAEPYEALSWQEIGQEVEDLTD